MCRSHAEPINDIKLLAKLFLPSVYLASRAARRRSLSSHICTKCQQGNTHKPTCLVMMVHRRTVWRQRQRHPVRRNKTNPSSELKALRQTLHFLRFLPKTLFVDGLVPARWGATRCLVGDSWTCAGCCSTSCCPEPGRCCCWWAEANTERTNSKPVVIYEYK